MKPLVRLGRKVPATQPRRLRLIDAVVLAAGSLLVLKLLGLFADTTPPKAPEPGFAHVLAQARSGYEPKDPVVTGATTPKEEPKAEAPPVPESPKAEMVRPTASSSPTERAILERLGERRDALQQRNRDLDVREKLIENAEKQLEGRIGELKTVEDRIEGGASKRGETESSALKNLVVMYETMKPKDAARVFDRLTLDVLVPVVLQMNPRKMAEVLALMQPEAAEKLTVALASRARGFGGDAKPMAATLPSTELPAITPAR